MARPIVEETLGKVLQSARQEFLEKGYAGASLGAIARKAGVTTGALYVRFPSKDALFGALVRPMAEDWMSFYRNGSVQGFELLEAGAPQEMWALSDKTFAQLVKRIYDDRDAFLLLANCAAGSSYENFLEQLVNEEESETLRFLEGMRRRGYTLPDIPAADIHVLVGAHYYAIFEIISHEEDSGEALSRLLRINAFFRPGWQKIFGS